MSKAKTVRAPKLKVITGGLTAPIGFKTSGLFCGIKKSRKKDLMLIAADKACIAAGVFTTNQAKAACVDFNISQLRRSHQAQAIVCNSGNANCMTGPRGEKDNREMAALTAKALGIPTSQVLTASTGVIGEYLPMGALRKGIRKAVAALDKTIAANQHAAEAILTTDLTIKKKSVEFTIGGKSVRLAAIAKGSGMLYPQMTVDGKKHATMLGFVTTDVKIAPSALQKALNLAVQKSFNAITVDGDQSTNDMVIVLASGHAGNKRLTLSSRELGKFTEVLKLICMDMAKEIVRDGEGATKFAEIVVTGARSDKEAHTVGMAVANSKLVKTALYGCDPNWGRIVASAGASGGAVNTRKLQIRLGTRLVFAGEKGIRVSKDALNKIFRQKNIRIGVHLNLGKGSATVWTCDLSSQYVRINSAYRT